MDLQTGKKRLQDLRESLEPAFRNASTGEQVCSLFADGMDRLLVDMLNDSEKKAQSEGLSNLKDQIAVIAIGGYGRGHLFPHSDVDLLVLTKPRLSQAMNQWISLFVRDTWDIGIQLGHSVRTIRETMSLVRQEPEVATGLVFTRLIWGNEDLRKRMRSRFATYVQGYGTDRYIKACYASRHEEIEKAGKATQVLEPNVKTSPGGLRDVHLMQWVAYALYRTTDLSALPRIGGLKQDEVDALRKATRYLTKVRMLLHLTNDRAQDVLSRQDQLVLAREFEYKSNQQQRDVELFMQEYFQNTTSVAEITERFCKLHFRRSIKQRLVDFLTTHRAEKRYLVNRHQLNAENKQLEELTEQIQDISDIFRSASAYRLPVSVKLLDAIRKRLSEHSGFIIDEVSARNFLTVLKNVGSVTQLIRQMHSIRLLDCFIPHFKHTRGLMQFNQYHQYTVDEHTFRVLEACEELENSDDLLGQCYREIGDKWLLHLAILLHDVGKGLPGDHSVVGGRIAREIGPRLRLTPEQTDLLCWLVEQHLTMSTTALRRDVNDPETIVEFSRLVSSASRLKYLFVLTASDMMGVGNGIWNEWKRDLLFALYKRTLASVTTDGNIDLLERQTLAIHRVIDNQADRFPGEQSQYAKKMLQSFPPHYILSMQPADLADDLATILTLQDKQVVCDASVDSSNGTVVYRVIVKNATRRIFHSLTGILTARRLEVLQAAIATSSEGVIVDRFRVQDNDFKDVDERRLKQVCEDMKQSIEGRISMESMFKRQRRYKSSAEDAPKSNLPAQIEIDIESSETFTIIDVFAHDRPGLLFTLSRALHDMELSVARAQIATHFDQVVDVFYVTDLEDRKIVDGESLRAIKVRLTQTLADFSRHGYKLFS